MLRLLILVRNKSYFNGKFYIIVFYMWWQKRGSPSKACAETTYEH